jgi:60 kDa SS-A/Ro ribonucleoprotein
VNYLKQYSTRRTPQSEPLDGQVPNSAGGHAWQVDDWMALHRFLVLGTEGGTYYVSERKLTVSSAKAVRRCIEIDGERAVREIVDVSLGGRAAKNDPAIFALALAASSENLRTRRLAFDALGAVCRTGTHLFTFLTYAEEFRGWGPLMRRAVARWYERDDLAYQLIKYRHRGGWTHRDVLRLCKPRPERGGELDRLFAWTVGKRLKGELPELIGAFERAQTVLTPRETIDVLREHPNLPREAINPLHLNSPAVWDALLENGMPMTALIRNLATMTRIGLLKPLSDAAAQVSAQIVDGERLRKARVHPLAILVALKTYEQGHSARGAGVWTPVPQVVEALDHAFYAAFGNVKASGKRTMLALDISASMDWGEIAGMPGITPRVGAAAMAMVTVAVEPKHYLTAFTTKFLQFTMDKGNRLDDVVRALTELPHGGTDCAVPMLYATAEELEVDTFIVYTDSETWAGSIHPVQALREYRRRSGINAKLVVVGMAANDFSIADPTDRGMLDVVGFDTATPNVIAEFSAPSEVR